MSDKKPLVLDVDGTFLRTDMLYECFWAGLGKKPIAVIKTCVRYWHDRPVLKQKLAEIAELRVDLLPVNGDVKALADAAQAEGQEVALASASHKPLVEGVAEVHDLSPRVFGTGPEINLKGAAKAQVLADTFGVGGFDYAGNEHVDRPIWDQAEKAIIVGNLPKDATELAAAGKEVTEIPAGWTFKNLLRALRPHQWVKNVLLLVPLISAHAFFADSLAKVLLGTVAFSAAASAIYIINDLLDLEADRLHATKHNRPFASGTVPVKVGMATFVVLCAIALGLGASIGLGFLAAMSVYMVLSLAYSLRLKRMRWVDIATLATLYTLRVVAGAAAVEVDVSVYLLILIYPTFYCLGCVKRLTEVTLAKDDARLPGRGYRRQDRAVLLNAAILSGGTAVGVFLLYSFSAHALSLYPTQWLLWLAAVPFALWIVRMVWLGFTGDQDYDPIVFAMRDKRGLGLIMLMLAIMFYSAGLWQEWFGSPGS